MLTEAQDTSTVQENQEQDVQTVVQTETQNPDLANERAYAKKQRMRAQAAEEELAKLREEAKASKEKALAEQGKYKEMYESLKKDATVWEQHSKAYNELVTTQKKELLSQLPESDQDLFKDLGVTQLKSIVDKLKDTKPVEPKVARGNVAPAEVKDFNNLSEAEKKANWGTYVRSHLKK
tara:strand:- start:212 stop:748 length:537 start_codon:yes stop_codon:yes gene_type:complete